MPIPGLFKQLKGKILCVLVSGIMVLFSMVIVTAADENTTISVGPLNQPIYTGDTFNVDVICSPSQPVKAFEFRLSFNPFLLEANSVTEGGFFDGYETFFNAGTIDNDEGSIVDIYGLIIGSGNVSDNGSLITISFTAKQNSGTSSVDINGVGVANEVGYISVGVYSGSVTIQTSGEESPPGGGDGYVPPIIDDENNPPQTPVKPSGPTLVEIGVEYVFESSTIDPDGDKVRFRFDWGDGNLSNWSGYVDSNVSVSTSHYWTYASSFEVRAIAQDENGLNSSWSLPLNVTVSQVVLGGNLPVAEIDFTGDLCENKTVVFDGSGSFDLDGFIVSYYWDFGDGEYGSGITSSHIYNAPGEYTVTLVVTDNNGNTFSKSIIVWVTSAVEEKLDGILGVFSFDLGFFIFGFLVLVLIGLGVFYRENIKSFLSSHHFDLHLGIFSSRDRIRNIDAKIRALKMDIETKADYKQPFVVSQNNYSDEAQRNHDEISRFIDSSVAFASEEESIEEFDGFRTGERVDNLIGMALKSFDDVDIGSRQGLDIDSTIDNFIFPKENKVLGKSNVDGDLFSRLVEDSVERKIDNIFDSKIRVKIDSLFEDS